MIGRDGKIHVALFSVTYGTGGGADRDWVSLVNALDPDRYDFTWLGVVGTAQLVSLVRPETVSCVADVGLPRFSYLLQGNHERPRSAFLWMRILADHLLRLRRPLRIARRVLADRRVDLVISNTAAVTLGCVLAAVLRRPHVWCVKEYLSPLSLASRRYARLIRAVSSAVVVPSASTAEIFEGKALVMPDGSDVAAIQAKAFCPSREEVLSRLALPPDRPIVAQVGALLPWKGQQVTLEALIRTASSSETPPYSLVFLGEGAPDHVRELQAMLAGIPPAWRATVRFASYGPVEYGYLSAADVVVHPSVRPDPYPNAVREAMILGRPVVASAGGGLLSMIAHGTTGVLVPPGDADALAGAIMTLVRSPDERRRLGECAREHALSAFDVQLTRRPFEDLMARVVSGQPRPPRGSEVL